MANDELSRRDKKIVEMAAAGNSALEIAESLGTQPERIVAEIERITTNINWLSWAQKEILLVRDLQSVLQAWIKPARELDEDAARNLAPLAKVLSEKMDKLAERAAADMERVEGAQKKEMLRIVELAYYRQLGRLQERYPEIASEDLDLEFRENLMEIAREADAASK